MVKGCLGDMTLQDAMREPEEFGKAVRCTAKAADQAASEACWAR